MIQIRWHGRGGQGAVTAAKIFGMAVANSGCNYAQSFPAFGVERRGAPVLAFTKIDSKPIWDRSQIQEPDIAVVLDPGLLKNVDVTSGLRVGGKILINADTIPAAVDNRGFEVIAIDATKIAMKNLGRPIANTAMVGILGAIVGLEVEAIEKAVRSNVPSKVIEKNIKVVNISYQEAKKAWQKDVNLNEK